MIKDKILFSFLMSLFCVSVGCSTFDLEDFDSVNTNNEEFNTELVKTFNVREHAQYDVVMCQGAACFGDYLFVCIEGGNLYTTTQLLVISAKDDFNILSIVDTGMSIHGNSLNFSNIYYDSNDEFPLLFASNFDILRIIKDSDSWSIQPVAKITSDVYNPTFAIDNERGRLYLFNYNDNKSWSVNKGEDKRNIIREFDLHRYDFTSDVSINMDEALSYYELPLYIVGQDVEFHNRMLFWNTDELSYSQYCESEGGIWCVDYDNKNIPYKVSYTRHVDGENEGVFFYNDELYFIMRTKTAMKIYKMDLQDVLGTK